MLERELTAPRVSYSYNARRGLLPHTRIGIVGRTRERHALCAEGLHFSAFHFFLHDVEKVLGYTLDRYGSYAAVMRHVWGDDTRAVREYIYGWLDCVNRYKDPVVTLATFEAVEMTLKPIFTTIYKYVYLPEGGLKGLEYFGQKHVELEANHSQFSWFRDEGTPFLPIGDLEITVEQRAHGLEVAYEIYERQVLYYFKSGKIIFLK